MKYYKYLSAVFFSILVIAIYGYRLNFPSDPYFDETFYKRFFHAFIFEHRYVFLTVHPLFWGLLTWPFLILFGQGMAVWRIVSLLAGLASIIVVYALAKKIFRSTLPALFAVFFFTFDCISLTQARIAIMNSLCLFFMILSLYIFLKYWMDQHIHSRFTLLLTGICLGLAISTKLAAFSMFIMIYLLYVQKLIKNKSEILNGLIDGMIFLFVLPIIIYIGVYTWIFSIPGCWWYDIWNLQVINLHYNLIFAATQLHTYSSFWWQWPLLLRPIWFYFAYHKGFVNGILCIGNPAIFWMIPVMIVCLLLDWFRQRRSVVMGIIILGFFTQWLFYAHAPRVTFFHYFYFSMPFVAMGMAWVCAQLCLLGKAGKWLVSLYMALVLVMFIFWYPLLTGMTISDPYYQTHIWLRTWI